MFDWVIEPVGEGEFTVEDDVKHVGQASASNTKFCTAPKDPFAGSMLVSGRIDPKPLFGEALDFLGGGSHEAYDQFLLKIKCVA